MYFFHMSTLSACVACYLEEGIVENSANCKDCKQKRQVTRYKFITVKCGRQL